MTTHMATEANVPIEILFRAEANCTNPFMDVMLDVEFSGPDGTTRRVPAFWAGGNEWRVRYASPDTGTYGYRNRMQQ